MARTDSIFVFFFLHLRVCGGRSAPSECDLGLKTACRWTIVGLGKLSAITWDISSDGVTQRVIRVVAPLFINPKLHV